ncbi:hypothetical protein DL95DRAFT_460610 [Leptodontidium sp. 2 PMI_412]|nr:hypothetical protein DL95DRAFT_460610 [Leptodontidium sp. 2 PMI_412]
MVSPWRTKPARVSRLTFDLKDEEEPLPEQNLEIFPAWKEVCESMRPWTQIFEENAVHHGQWAHEMQTALEATAGDATAVNRSRWAQEIQAELEKTADEVSASLKFPVRPIDDPQPPSRPSAEKLTTTTITPTVMPTVIPPTSLPGDCSLASYRRATKLSLEMTPLTQTPVTASSSTPKRNGELRRIKAVINLRSICAR